MGLSGAGNAATGTGYLQSNTAGNTLVKSRLIQNAAQETQRAVDRVHAAAMMVEAMCNRIFGVYSPPAPTGAQSGANTAKQPEADDLNTTLSNLHAHLTTLEEQVGRLEAV